MAGLSACASAELGPPVSKDKKLLAFACDLVNTRYLEDRVTVFTTNFFDKADGIKESLADRVSVRIRSRLHEMCRCIMFYGYDYRAERLASREGGLRL